MKVPDINALTTLIFNAITTIIAIVGFLYGGYSLWDGFTNDQPENKKKGIQVIVVTAVICGVIVSAKSIFI
ncbi:MAG: hypothetical protein RSB38_00285 [Oscillospiraceae bacterium]